jgi:hypothetical protein
VKNKGTITIQIEDATSNKVAFFNFAKMDSLDFLSTPRKKKMNIQNQNILKIQRVSCSLQAIIREKYSITQFHEASSILTFCIIEA